LRLYSRRDPITVKPIDVHGLIREASELARHGAPKTMAIELQLQASESLAMGDAALIETALVNLALNSRDAMPNGGTLTFCTKVVTLDKPIANSHAFDLQPGRFLEIAISDTGTGMDAAVMAHLFEPFFTTKESGRGTGLGLANVYACIKHHHGAIAVDSSVGQGTTFRIWLPLAPAGAVNQPTAPISGAGTVLVVDDDPALRTLAADMLTVLGYRCVLAADGDEAIARCAEQAIDLVLLDMIMPKRDGGQTIPLLREHDRTIRILLCSGSIEDDVEALQLGANGFLRKPYQLGSLSQAVASMIKKGR
jgi:CheY-like chemotaxis protein